MALFEWIKEYIAPIWSIVSILLALRPWLSRKLTMLRTFNADRINKKIARYTELKNEPKLFYSSILNHILVAFCVIGIAIAYDSMFLSEQQVKLAYAWRTVFGMLLYIIAFNGVVSIRIINRDFDKTIDLLNQKLKKIEAKNQ